MKILILSITAGHGHHAAAKSISDAFLAKNAEVKIIDVYKQSSKFLYNFINRGYLLTTKYTKRPYSAIYKFLEKKKYSEKKHSRSSLLVRTLAKRFEKHINEYSPDAIICTHVFAAQVVNELKSKGKLKTTPTIAVLTDYTFHPYWERIPLIEYIQTPNERLSQKAKMKGIDTSRLVHFGIPVQKKFFSKIPKEDACKTIGLSPTKNTILLMAGSMGYGNLPKLISEILTFDNECQILAICGNNKKQLKKLESKKYDSNVKLFGFTDQVDLFMDAADCVITKPGGLTTSEALAKRLPMILTNPIPGQEERNLDFFLNTGGAISITKTFSTEEALHFLFADSSQRERMAKQLDQLAKPDAANTLVDFVSNLLSCKKD